MKPLDFVIIGAQKSATTALFSYLQNHPSIEMPVAKEAPFFTSEHLAEDDWQQFAAAHFSDESKLWGKASPQYMADFRIPERLHQYAPNAKLIAILRDPIDRAYSHFQMAKRRATEDRSFDEIVAVDLDPLFVQNAREGSPPLHLQGYEPESDYYFVWGEYGRILSDFCRVFPREQLLVLTTVEVKNHPQQTLDKVLSFLGLRTGYTPANLGEVVHQGGGGSIIPASLPKKIVNLPIVNVFWSWVPNSFKETARYWFEQKNVKTVKPNHDEKMTAASRQKLQDFYAKDIELLRDSLGVDVPWATDYKAN